jgi:hypothetical protein
MVLDRYEEQLKQVIAWHEREERENRRSGNKTEERYHTIKASTFREALSMVRMLRQADKEELDAHG